MPRPTSGPPGPRPPPSPQAPRIYQSPPGSGGNDGAMPTAYNFNWQYFTNLTPAQVAWFQAQPEWQNFLTYVTLSPTTAVVATPITVVNAALQAAGLTIVAVV